MRLFVAITPPPAALVALDAALGPARVSAPHGLRWTRPEQWHLTLAFLGEVGEAEVTGLIAGLDDTLGSDPLRLRLAGGGCFGDRVLWVGLAGDVAGLRAEAAQVVRAARAAGVDLADRGFRPHLTLARAGSRLADLRPAASALADVMGPVWDVDAVRLVRSRLGAGPGGAAVHEVIAHWPRRGTPGTA